MTAPKSRWIQPGISVGNLIVLGSMLIGLATSWTTMQSALGEHERRITENADELKELRREQHTFSMGFAELRADMRHLLEEVSRTRKALEQLERERRQ